jgi:hypothetical protein
MGLFYQKVALGTITRGAVGRRERYRNGGSYLLHFAGAELARAVGSSDDTQAQAR